MSIQSIQSSITNVQREIASLNTRRSEKTRQESDKGARIVSIQRSVTSHTSVSMLQSKQREIQSLQNSIIQIQKDKASIDRQLADKTAKLHRFQQDLEKEREREQKKFQDTLRHNQRAGASRQHAALGKMLGTAPSGLPSQADMPTAEVQYDAFISHASEDKEEVARPLAEALRSCGHSIWYDEFQLKVGDSLRRSIDRGLSKSRFGIVILSPAFFAKNWPQYELDGLVSKEISGGKVILPIWHKVSKDEVMEYSPSLADKMALNTAVSTVTELSQQLSDALRDR